MNLAIIKAQLIDKEDGEVRSIFTMERQLPLGVKGRIQQVIAWELDGTPLDMEFFADFTVKWDGCSHFTFSGQDTLEAKGQEDLDGYYHICGIRDYLSFMRNMVFAYTIMKEYVDKLDFHEEEAYEDMMGMGLLDDFKIIYTYEQESGGEE